METHAQPLASPGNASTPANQDTELTPGSPVIYALHGKCSILSIETRQAGQELIRFYKLEPQKSALSRSTRQEPSIWVPVAKAEEQGLRLPMNIAQAEAVLKILSSREYYFPTDESWSTIQPKLEGTIRAEGGAGLAKVVSYLYVLKRKQVVATTEVNRMQEVVTKLLLRELSEVLVKPMRALEEQIAKLLRHKLIPDN